MKYCPHCQQTYPKSQRFCLEDGQLLSLEDPFYLVGRTLLDKYRIEALVGVGGMGAVYGAHHLTINRRVAFKILLPHLALGNERTLNLFEREAKMAGQLSHENIVDVKDAGRTQDKIAYIVMEWLEGHTLEDEIQEAGQLSLERAAELLRQIAAALDAAHAGRIVHRDLKPSNVMLVQRPDGHETVKVLDFGIAKVTSDTTASPVSMIMGTPHYASPEQFRLGESIDQRSDIYSLGVILYQMLTGALPFQASTISELIRLQATHPPPSLRQLRRDVPAAIDQLINSMLASDPAKRPQSAGEVAAAFWRAVKEPDRFKTAADATIITSGRQSAATDEMPPAGNAPGRPTVADEQRVTAMPPTEPSSATVTEPSTKVEPAPEPAHKHARRPPRLLVAGVAAGVVLILLVILWPTPVIPPSPPSSPSPTPASRAEVMRYYLEVSSNGGRTSRQAGGEPLAADQTFKFHFIAREPGYLYIVAPDEKNVPTTFLTAQPMPQTGVKTNRVEAGVDYSFPSGAGSNIGITRDEDHMAFTVIFSPTPLTAPTFFNTRAGRGLNATEQNDLMLFRQQHSRGAPEITREPGGAQSVVLVTTPGGGGERGPWIIDIPIEIRSR